MKHRILTAAIVAQLLFQSFTAWGQSAAAAPDNSLDEVVVVANRAPEPLSKVGNSVTVLDAYDIQQSQAVVASDLLAQTPGITVARNGGPGQPTSVFIRGAESDQTVVVIDGVTLNDPSQPAGGFDFENLLIGDISRIEILRGAQSTLYVVAGCSSRSTERLRESLNINSNSSVKPWIKLWIRSSTMTSSASSLPPAILSSRWKGASLSRCV